MADVSCPNDECSEHGVPKSNPGGYPAEMIHCGACGGPVEEVEPPPDAS